MFLKKLLCSIIILQLISQFHATKTLAETIENNNTINSSIDNSSEKYVMVANTSIEPNSASEYTGTFNVKYQKSLNRNLDLGSNKMDRRISQISSITNSMVPKYTNTTKYNVGNTRIFYLNGTNKTVNATLMFSSKKAQIWTTSKIDFTNEDLEKLGTEFDEKIYPTVTKYFGEESDVNHDGKIDILFHDIQDEFETTGAYISGYFDPYDIEPINYQSFGNNSEILHIDTYPSLGTSIGHKDITKAYDTIAHEFQHMVSFNQNVLVENDTQLDTWIDEGLSMASEEAYSGKVLNDRIDYYNHSDSIKKGKSLLLWDEDDDVLSNYALSYLFFQYLKIQCEQGDNIFKEIIDDQHHNYLAVENVIQKYIDPKMSFSRFLLNFHKALFLKESEGPYGFHGIEGFNKIAPQIYEGNGTSLKSGGVIFKKITNGIPNDKGQDIAYVGLDHEYVDPAKIISVNKMNDMSQSIIGKTEKNRKVIAMIGDKEYSTVSNENGDFEISIPQLPANTKIQLFTVDMYGSKGDIETLIVSKSKLPKDPVINQLGDNNPYLTGYADPNTKIIVLANGHTFTSKTNSIGNFLIYISFQHAGNLIRVYSQDEFGSISKTVIVKVRDLTPPRPPIVNPVTTKTTEIAGKAEKGTTVFVYTGKKFLYKTVVKSNGTFSMKIKKLKRGTVLGAYAKDQGNNNSKTVYIKVK